MHLDEISRNVARKAHAVVLMAKKHDGPDGTQRAN